MDHFSKGRLTGVMLGCICFGSILLFRAAYIQLPGHSRLENMARRQFQSRALIRPRRGAILDRNGDPLAVNMATDSLAANPLKIKKKRKMARLLSRATELSYHYLLAKLHEQKEFIWIKRHISPGELKKFKKWRLVDSEGDFVDGLWLVKESERVYPHGQIAAQIVGDVNVDSEGLEGVELWMNEKLRGKVVSFSALKDAYGRPTFIDADAAKNVQDGESITLTIDSSLQYEVEQHLKNAVTHTNSKSGTVIVMNADNGEILALANEPSFNPNEKSVAVGNRRNRALTDGFEPGSTFKAILAASALSNGWKLTDQVWGERGSFEIQGHKISEAEAHEKFEWVSLKQMLQVSSNVAAAKIALKVGPEKFLRMIKSFGFGEKTGIGFPGEISGKIPPRKEWRSLALANIGFGQGVLVTPIQMARAYSVLANGGLMVKPKLILKSNNLSPTPPVRILSSRVARDLTEALVSVTEEGGTGTSAALPGYRIAGKTGTAQMVDPKTGKYSREKYVASFIGFPVGVEPHVVIFTSLIEPKGVYYAAQTAAPLFKEVLSSVVNHFGLPSETQNLHLANVSTMSDQIHLSQASWIQSSELPSLLAGQSQSTWIIPPLKGLTPREALKVLKGHRFQVEMVGNGVVSYSIPSSDKGIGEGGTIRLFLSEP